jgi:hypothetical protein
MKCTVENCCNKYYAKGYCEKHYLRVKKHGNTEGLKPQAPAKERFFKFVEKTDKCWNWVGNKRGNYGGFSIGARTAGTVLAHRFSWELHNNKTIPSKMVVMHSCDNPLCVNPAHLSIGTHMNNTHDMLRKGRHTYIAHVGNKNGKAIINADIVKQIRESNLSNAELGRQFNVSPNCIRGVRTGRTWSHI